MSLKDLKIPRVPVQIPDGGSFSVRGLSLVDLRTLFAKYGNDMSEFFDMVVNTKDGAAMDLEEAASLATLLLEQLPAMAADAIAMAADEPDSYETVLLLPFPTQVEAMQAIGKATFGTEGGVKKFLQTAKTLMGAFREKPLRD